MRTNKKGCYLQDNMYGGDRGAPDKPVILPVFS